MLKSCSCRSSFQDEKYGKNIRIHTEGKKGEERCTVCGPKPAMEARLVSHAKNCRPLYSQK